MQRIQYALRIATAASLLVILTYATGCAPWQIGAEHDVVKNGIAFKDFRENKDGSKIGNLAKDTEIDGWPCKQGFIAFHADWKLDELQLSKDHERNGIFMPAGTWVFPDKNGNPGVCIFQRDIEIQGYLCRGSGSGKQGFMTSFYASGKLKQFFSRDPVTVNGVVCDDSLFHGISLHENGSLKQCKLNSQVDIGGVSYRSGSIICLDESGKVLE